MEKINIAEILKDAPRGTKLYSPVYGEVFFAEIRYGDDGAENEHAISAKDDFSILCSLYEHSDGCKIGFDPYGCLFRSEGAEVMLFPSKDNRDWSTFKAPWKHKNFEPFEKVLVNLGGKWCCDFYSHYDEEKEGHVSVSLSYVIKSDILPYSGNEDKLGKKIEK